LSSKAIIIYAKQGKRGFYFYFCSGTFDSEGSTELQDAGKAGLITIQGKISAVLGTVLVCKSNNL
jgi:hypothetical protein